MNILIDIDGTVSEDIPNAEDYRFANAQVLDNAVESVNKLYDAGHNITFFTARLTKHREVTEQWLKKHKFKYHALLTDNLVEEDIFGLIILMFRELNIKIIGKIY